MAAPDGVTGSFFSIVVGMFGQATPYNYLTMILQSLDYADTHVLSWPQMMAVGVQRSNAAAAPLQLFPAYSSHYP